MKKILILIALIAPISSFAGAFDQLNNNLAASTAAATSSLQTTAILWLSSFVLIQMVMTNIGLLKSGADIEAIFGKLIGSLMWFGFCFYVLKNGPNFIKSVSQEFFSVASSVVGGTGFDPSSIVGTGASIAAGLVAKINQATGLTLNFLPAIMGGLIGVVILGTAAFIAFKVFLINIETMLIIMLAPLSFAFLGLNALKDQGIAPFKSLISLAYRIIILAILLKAMGVMSDNLITVIDSINSSSIDGIWSTIFAASIGYTLLAFLVFKSDSIAASLASGSTNLGTAEVASAAAIGAAVGGAIGAGGDSAKGGATKAASGISGMMQKLAGNSSPPSLSNAAGSGGGGGARGSTGASSSTMSTSLAKPTGGAASNTLADDAKMATAGRNGYTANSPSQPQHEAPAADIQQQIKGDAARVNSAMNSVGGDPIAAADKRNRPGSGSGEPAGGQGSGSVGMNSPSPASSSDLQKPDSGQNAGIGDGTAPKSPNPTPTTGSSGGNRKGSIEYLSDLNKHMANEKSSVSVSINTHHSD